MIRQRIAPRSARLVAVVVAIAVVAGLLALAPAVPGSATPPATAGTPAELPGDVPAGHPFAEEIGWLLAGGVAEGYGDGTFGPSSAITRQAMAAYLARSLEPEAAPPACAQAPFFDVPVDHPFCAEIAWMVATGLAEGYADGTFGPGRPVTRQAAAAYLGRADGGEGGAGEACAEAPFSDVPVDHPFCSPITWISSSRIALGYADGTFGPAAPVSRQAVAAFFYRIALLADEGAPVASSGCGSSTAEPGRHVQVDLEVAGEARWFLLTVPPAHDGTTPLSLVVDLHGLSEGAQIHTAMSQYSDFAEDEGFVVAYPHGRFSPVRWDADPTSDPNHDLLFVDAILDTLGQRLCLDESRAYATGLSYGAMMTSLLTCARSSRFAAVAPVAGVVVPDPCPQGRSVPILAFHGTDDAILPYEGGVGEVPGGVPDDGPDTSPLDRGYAATMALWAERNGCRPGPVDHHLTDEVIHRVWECPVGADVEFFIIVGGGHTWPGSTFSRAFEEIMGYTTMDVHASGESWAFFQRFWRP
jgi:polyhydroxybutyrate depolymerase